MSETAPDVDLRETPLAALHRSLGARMVGFAGYTMPVQYPTGIVAEHNWTRTHASLFDVSHMGPARLVLRSHTGDAAADHQALAAIVEAVTCGDIGGLKPGRIRYTLLLNDAGGILDDLMVARPASPAEAGSLYIVVNAATKDADFAVFAAAAGPDAELRRRDDHALIALQGPEAVDVMARLMPATTDLAFMTHATFPLEGTDLVVSRSGYTGEDGFEVLVPPQIGVAFCARLLEDARVRPAGLGARDSLRLEAGLPLYGSDLDETVSPIEADLAFAVSKRRREAADFPGAARIMGELDSAPARLRVGLLVDGAPARHGTDIMDQNGVVVGQVTSGGFSPTLGRPIAMGFAPPPLAAAGTALQVSVRGRHHPATVTRLPFVPHRYVRKPVLQRGKP